jgi:hypothetical protein
MAMVAELSPDPEDKLLSTLSKVPWCVDILREIARKGSLARLIHEGVGDGLADVA